MRPADRKAASGSDSDSAQPSEESSSATPANGDSPRSSSEPSSSRRAARETNKTSGGRRENVVEASSQSVGHSESAESAKRPTSKKWQRVSPESEETAAAASSVARRMRYAAIGTEDSKSGIHPAKDSIAASGVSSPSPPDGSSSSASLGSSSSSAIAATVSTATSSSLDANPVSSVPPALSSSLSSGREEEVETTPVEPENLMGKSTSAAKDDASASGTANSDAIATITAAGETTEGARRVYSREELLEIRGSTESENCRGKFITNHDVRLGTIVRRSPPIPHVRPVDHVRHFPPNIGRQPQSKEVDETPEWANISAPELKYCDIARRSKALELTRSVAIRLVAGSASASESSADSQHAPSGDDDVSVSSLESSQSAPQPSATRGSGEVRDSVGPTAAPAAAPVVLAVPAVLDAVSQKEVELLVGRGLLDDPLLAGPDVAAVGRSAQPATRRPLPVNTPPMMDASSLAASVHRPLEAVERPRSPPPSYDSVMAGFTESRIPAPSVASYGEESRLPAGFSIGRGFASSGPSFPDPSLSRSQSRMPPGYPPMGVYPGPFPGRFYPGPPPPPSVVVAGSGGMPRAVTMLPPGCFPLPHAAAMARGGGMVGPLPMMTGSVAFIHTPMGPRMVPLPPQPFDGVPRFDMPPHPPDGSDGRSAWRPDMPGGFGPSRTPGAPPAVVRAAAPERRVDGAKRGK